MIMVWIAIWMIMMMRGGINDKKTGNEKGGSSLRIPMKHYFLKHLVGAYGGKDKIIPVCIQISIR